MLPQSEECTVVLVGERTTQEILERIKATYEAQGWEYFDLVLPQSGAPRAVFRRPKA